MSLSKIPTFMHFLCLIQACTSLDAMFFANLKCLIIDKIVVIIFAENVQVVLISWKITYQLIDNG